MSTLSKTLCGAGNSRNKILFIFQNFEILMDYRRYGDTLRVC